MLDNIYTYFSKLSFSWSVKVTQGIPFNTMLLQKSYSFFESNFNNWVFTLEWLELELFIYGFQLPSESLFKVTEDIGE